MELALDALLTTTSWRMQRTIGLLELLQKVYDLNRLTLGGHSIRRTAVPGRVRRASIRGTGVQKGRVPEGASEKNQPPPDWGQGSGAGRAHPAARQPVPDARGDSTPAETGTLNWNTAFRQGARPRLLLAAAGMGKTFSSRWAAAQQAYEMAAALRGGHLSLEEVRIPVWVEASKLAAIAGATLSDRLQRWAVTLLDEHGVTDPETQELLLRRLRPGGGDTWTLYLDSLDEMRHSEVIRFRQLMGTGGIAGHGLVLTSRPGVDLRNVLPPGFPPYDVLELLPFDETEQAEFLHRYEEALREPEEGKTRALPTRTWLGPLRAALETDVALRSLAATPLLMRFMCDLAENGSVVSGLSEGDLYRSMIDSLLDGRWRAPEPMADLPRQSAPIASQQLRLRTRCLSGELFLRFPEARAFTYEEWMQAYSAAAAREPRLFEDCRPQGMLTEWEQLALVRVAGDQWVYGHKTFMDYLAAEYLAGQKAARRRELVVPVLGFVRGEIYGCHTGWEQTLDFLAAQRGPHAAELVRLVEEIIERDGDDFARPLLALQIRWAVRAGTPLPVATRRRLAQAVVEAGIGAGSSLLGGKPRSLYAWAQRIYEDIARDEVMAAAAARQLEKEKSTYGLGLLGTPEACAAIRRRLAGVWLWEARTADWLRRWKVEGFVGRMVTQVSCLCARLCYLHSEDSGLGPWEQYVPALADLARAGDDHALARWARRLSPRIKAEVDENGWLPYPPKTLKERLGSLLLLCGGPASMDLLFKGWTGAHTPAFAWDDAMLSEALQGPHAATLTRRLFDLAVTGQFDARVLTRISFPGMDHALAEYQDNPRRFLGARSLDTELTALGKQRVSVRSLLLRHAAQAQPVISQLLNEEELLSAVAAGDHWQQHYRESWIAQAIRAAGACGMIQFKPRVVALADSLEDYQVIYQAVQYLGEHGEAADLPRIDTWLHLPTIAHNPNNAHRLRADRPDESECARTALLLKAVEARLKLAPDQGAEFVRAALEQMWTTPTGWQSLRIQDQLETVYIPDTSGYGYGESPLDRLLTLVAAEAPEQAVALIDQVVAPRLDALRRRHWKGVLSFWHWRELMSHDAPWTPPHGAVTALWKRARILRAMASGDLDHPGMLDDARTLLVERGGVRCFQHLCDKLAGDKGVIHYRQSSDAEQVFTMAARLKLRASKKLPSPVEELGTSSWAEVRPWPDTEEITATAVSVAGMIVLLMVIGVLWNVLNADAWMRRVWVEFADRAWDSSTAAKYSLVEATKSLSAQWPGWSYLVTRLGRWQDALGIACLAVIPLTTWRYGVHTLLRGAHGLPAWRKLGWSAAGLVLLWVPALAILALLAGTGIVGPLRLRFQALGFALLLCLLTSDVQRCLRMWVIRRWHEHATLGLCLGWAVLACAVFVPAVALWHAHRAAAVLSATAAAVFAIRCCGHASDLYEFWLQHHLKTVSRRPYACALVVLAIFILAFRPLSWIVARWISLLLGGWGWPPTINFSTWTWVTCLAGLLGLGGAFVLDQLRRIVGDVAGALAGRAAARDEAGEAR